MFGVDTDSRREWGLLTAGATGGLLLVVVAVSFLLSTGLPARAFGLSKALAATSGVVLASFGLVTQLGDPWFLVFLATLVFLAGTEHELVETPADGAFVLAVLFGALAFTDVLKNLFALPRPPGAAEVAVPVWLPILAASVFQNATTGTGYAFPSGHALVTTAVYGALALRLRIGTPRLRWAGAAVVVTTVVLSRLVLGVHYLVDVVAGVFAGLALLGAVAYVGNRRPVRAFGVAVAVAVAGVLAAAVSPKGAVWAAGQWFGAALGAGLAWYAVRPSSVLGWTGTVAAGLVAGVLWVGTYVLSPSLVATVAATAVAAAVTVTAPTVADRLG